MWVSLNCSDTDFSNIIPKLRLRPVHKLERPHWHTSLRSWLLLSFNKSLRNVFQKLKMFQYLRLKVYCSPFQKKIKRQVIDLPAITLLEMEGDPWSQPLLVRSQLWKLSIKERVPGPCPAQTRGGQDRKFPATKWQAVVEAHTWPGRIGFEGPCQIHMWQWQQERAAEDSGEGSGQADKHRASGTPGRCPTACRATCPESLSGVRAQESETRAEPLQGWRKSLVPVSVFWSKWKRALLVLRKEIRSLRVKESLTIYYGLDYVCPNFMCWNPNPQRDYIWR